MNTAKTRKSVTLSVTLNVPYETAFDYLTNPGNLPDWSINFIKQVKDVDGQLIAKTPMGDVPLTIRSDHDTGIFDMTFGGATTVPTRLVRNGKGCDYLFTLHQPPNMPDEVWENEGVPGLGEELDTLKRVLESRE